MVNEARRQIIAGVWSVIARHGLAAVSMRSIAAAAGVSVGMVQRQFGTKSELVRASVIEMLDGAQEAYPEAVADPREPSTLWSLLTHSLGPAERSRRGVSVFYAYVAASVADPWIGDQIAEAKQGQIRYVAECLALQYPQLADPGVTAAELVAVADGCTQAVYLGYSTAEAATSVIRGALDRLNAPC